MGPSSPLLRPTRRSPDTGAARGSAVAHQLAVAPTTAERMGSDHLDPAE